MHIDNNSRFDYNSTEFSTIVGNKIYTVSYTLPTNSHSSNYAPLIQKMVRSFEIYNSTQQTITENRPPVAINQSISSLHLNRQLQHTKHAGTANQLEQMGNNTPQLQGNTVVGKKPNLTMSLSKEQNPTGESSKANITAQKQPGSAGSSNNANSANSTSQRQAASSNANKTANTSSNAAVGNNTQGGLAQINKTVSLAANPSNVSNSTTLSNPNSNIEFTKLGEALKNLFDGGNSKEKNMTLRPSLANNLTKNQLGLSQDHTNNNLNNSYNLKIEGINYPINYQITGKGNRLDNITTDSDILNIDITSPSQGIFTIELPRSLIDSKNSGTSNDSNYVVLIDGSNMALPHEVSSTSLSRTLTFSFPSGSKQFGIIGSEPVPNNNTIYLSPENANKNLTTNQTQLIPGSKSGYDQGCNDAKIPNLSDRYINQPGKGPRDHSNEFMCQYKKGFNDCSKVITPIPQPLPQNLTTCKDQIFPGIGEINPSPIGHGLRINIDIAGATDGAHPARINVTGPSGETLCHDMMLTSTDQSMLFYFYPGVIPNGQHFDACITFLDTNKKSCVEGVNHQGRQSESVQLRPPI
jgi:hypothetical protein